MFRIQVLIGTIFLSLLLNSVTAQDDATPDLVTLRDTTVQYHLSRFGVADGLISTDVSTLFQDSDGVIWVGTRVGVSRYAGYPFDNYTQARVTPMGRIYAIAEDAEGRIWVGGTNGLFTFHEEIADGSFEKARLDVEDVRGLREDALGNLWVVGIGFVPFMLNPERKAALAGGDTSIVEGIVTSLDWERKIGNQRTRGLDIDHQGKVWFALDNRHAYYDGRELHVTWQDTSRIILNSAVLAFSPDSIYWGSERSGLIYENKGHRRLRIAPATYLMQATDSAVYFVTTQEIAVVQGGRWTRLYGLGQLDGLYPQAMLLDREGNFWIGGVGSLVKLTPSRFRMWTVDTDSLMGTSYSVHETPAGEVLVGGGGGRVSRLAQSGISEVETLDMPINSLITNMTTDVKGRQWFATTLNGLAMQHEGRTTFFGTAEGLGDRTQHFIGQISDQGLWSASDDGITQIIDDGDGRFSFVNYRLPDAGTHIVEFTEVFSDSGGGIWTISDRGLYHLVDGQLKPALITGDWIIAPILSGVAKGQDGRLWFATRGQGLWECEQEAGQPPHLIRRYRKWDGLMSEVLLDVLVDRQGRVWTSSEIGVCKVEIRPEGPHIDCIDQTEGWPLRTTPHSKLLESSDSTLWAVNLTSIQSVPLYRQTVASVPPKTIVHRVTLFDGYSLRWGRPEQLSNMFGGLIRPRIPQGKSYIRADFASTAFRHPEKNRFRVNMTGREPAWQLLPPGQRDITFFGLGPGEHTLSIQAENSDGVRGDIETFTFRITPPIYLRWWFFLLVGIGLFFIGRFLLRAYLTRESAKGEAIRLQELDDFKSRFYANVTHDFRTPLTVIKGMSAELKDRVGGREAEFVTMIQRNSDALLDRVDKMLELSRIQAGNYTLDWERVEMVGWLRSRVATFDWLARQKPVNLSFHTTFDHLEMDVDRFKFGAIVDNVLGNAVKFTPANGRVNVQVSKALHQGAPHLRLSIQDTGPGIPDAQESRLFERYARHNTREAGTGLGLAIVRELVVLLNGTIEVNSREGEGSEFLILFPIHHTADSGEGISCELMPTQALPREARNSQLLPEGDRPLILLVEDDRDVMTYLRLCLGAAYRVISAADGHTGFAQVKEHEPDAIVSDVMLPGMSGLEMCRRIRESEPLAHIPIVLLTARVELEDRVEGLSMGADAYLTKPFAKEELLAQLKQVLLGRARMAERIRAIAGDTGNRPEVIITQDSFLQQAEKIILDELDNSQFTPDEFARRLHLSSSQTYRKIKSLTDLSTAVYIRSIRLREARQLLHHPELTVSEIAHRAGFTSPAYFSQCFKATYEQSPSAYRDDIL
ncbi:MAG: response regulator [Lewinella sp.]